MIPLKDVAVIFPSLFNIMLLNPRYGKYVVSYLKKNILQLDVDLLCEIVNKELKITLKNRLQEETLLLMQIIRELGLKIDIENLIKLADSEQDFAIIIALDLWKNNKNNVIRNRLSTIEFNKKLKSLSDSLKGEQYAGPRWLLLHEILMHKLLPKKLRPIPNNDLFFDEMVKEKVSFYKSIK